MASPVFQTFLPSRLLQMKQVRKGKGKPSKNSVLGWLRSVWQALFGRQPHWLTSTPRQRLGAKAERAAARYLRRQGYKILATNVMTKHGEVDILARDGEFLCFIEVRSITEGYEGFARPALTREKERHIAAAMDAIVKERGWQRRKRRADLVEVYLDERGKPMKIEVYKAAIGASQR